MRQLVLHEVGPKAEFFSPERAKCGPKPMPGQLVARIPHGAQRHQNGIFAHRPGPVWGTWIAESISPVTSGTLKPSQYLDRLTAERDNVRLFRFRGQEAPFLRFKIHVGPLHVPEFPRTHHQERGKSESATDDQTRVSNRAPEKSPQLFRVGDRRVVFDLRRGNCTTQIAGGVEFRSAGLDGIPENLTSEDQSPVGRLKHAALGQPLNDGEQLRRGNFRDLALTESRE